MLMVQVDYKEYLQQSFSLGTSNLGCDDVVTCVECGLKRYL